MQKQEEEQELARGHKVGRRKKILQEREREMRGASIKEVQTHLKRVFLDECSKCHNAELRPTESKVALEWNRKLNLSLSLSIWF